MSDLPSPKQIAAIIKAPPRRNARITLKDRILEAYASDRLFDREAIDRKAHETMLQRFTGYLLQGNTIGTSIDEVGVLSGEMLAAAIGDTDKRKRQ